MTRCPRCHGTGQLPDPQARTPQPPRRLIPFGHECEIALRAHKLRFSPSLLLTDRPALQGDRWITVDRWDDARRINAQRAGSVAMVLPEGTRVSEYRYPALPFFEPTGVQLVAYGYGLLDEDRQEIGRALIAAGFDQVQVLGDAEPLEFRAS